VEPINQTSPSSTQAQQMPENSGLELKDIHLPEQINDFPIALGWWLLAAMIILSIIFAIYKYRSYKKLRINQKQAIAQLQLKPTINDTIKILKWAAMQYFPRQQIANLYGQEFQQFLLNHLVSRHQEVFTNLSSPAFESLYKNHSEQEQQKMSAQLHQASILWLNNALPPKKPLNTENIQGLG